MKAWFAQFSQREQIYLLIAVTAVLLYVLYVGFWQPVAGMRTDMASQNERMTSSLELVQSMSGELQRLQVGASGSGRRNLNQLVNSTTAKQKLRPSRIQPNSRGELQVRFEDADFSSLLRWLHQLEYVEEVPVLEVSITQGDRGGLVNANVRLGQGS